MDWQEVVGIADQGLYAAKRSGRNRWVGIEAGEAEHPETALRRFRKDPEASVAGREVRVQAPEESQRLQWM